MTSRDIVLTSPYLLRQLLLEPNYDETISLCRTNRLGASICRDRSFWAEKAELNLGIKRDYFYHTLLSPHRRYLELAVKLGLDFSMESRSFLITSDFIRRSIQFGYDLPEDIKDDPNTHLLILLHAAEFNNTQLILTYLGKTKDFNYAASGALRGGHGQLLDTIRSLAPDDYPWNYYFLLGGAIMGGDITLIEDIRSRISGTYSADQYRIIVQLAALNKNPTIIDYVISNMLPVNYVIDWQAVGELVARAANENNLAYILTKHNNWNWNELAEATISHDNDPDLGKLELILASAPKGYRWNYNRLVLIALNNHKLYAFEMFKSMAPIDYEWNTSVRAKLSSMH